jgi:hypothetical protein
MHPQHFEQQVRSNDAQRQRYFEAAKYLFEIGINASNLTEGEICLRRACGILECLCSTVSEDGKASMVKDSPLYPTLLHARLRLGQIAASNGNIEEAFLILRSIVLDDCPGGESSLATL